MSTPSQLGNVDHPWWQRPQSVLWVGAVGVWVGAWCGLATSGQLLRRDLPLVAIILALTTVLLLLLRRRLPRTGAGLLTVLVVCVAGSWLAAAVRVAPDRAGPVQQLASQHAQVQMEAVLTSDPKRVRPDPQAARPAWAHANTTTYWSMTVRVSQVQGRGQLHQVRTPVVAVLEEQQLRAASPNTLLPSQPVTLLGGLVASSSAHGPPILRVSSLNLHDHPSLLNRVAGRLREGLRQASAVLPAQQAGLLPGLVVGDESGISDSQDAAFRAAGLTHVTAVSGANCVLVIGAVLALARLLRVPARADAWLALLVLAGFVVVARPQPSVLRAAVMAGLSLLALAGARARPVATALAAAVFGLLVVQPELARSYGFALSVAATAGIIAGAGRLARAWQARCRWLPRPVVQACAVTVAAGVACAPILVLLTPQVSWVSIPANVVVAACVGPATVAGFAVLVLAPFSLVAAQACAWCAWLPTTVMVHTAKLAAAVPGGALPWLPGVAGALSLLVIIALAVAFGPRVWQRRRRWWGPALAGALAAVVVLALVLPRLPRPEAGWPPADWVAMACEVGQGDALVLRSGPGSAVVIDAGPDPQAVRDCLDRLDITQVPLVVLTHFHADHVAGLAGVFAGRHVGRVWVSPLPAPGSQARRVRELAAAAGVPVEVATQGRQVQVGMARLHVVWPGANTRASPPGRFLPSDEQEQGEGSTVNNASVVMAATVQSPTRTVSFALMGDAEPLAQSQLRSRLLAALPTGGVDVLKVAHHGSAKQDYGLMRALHPTIAVISCGLNNDYGHPAPALLQALSAQAITTARTDVHHNVAVTIGHGQLVAAGLR